MKKILILILCLSLLTGCISVPAYGPQRAAGTAAATAAPTQTASLPTPGVTREPVPAATFTAAPAAAPTLTPAPTATPKPSPSTPPAQTYSGVYFRFSVPGDWLRADVPGGAYFYPDQIDTRHAYLLYQETANEMKLTESSLDIALLFSSKETITAMVEGALTNSGMTGFKLSPVTIAKTKLNDATCYKGASDITIGGETFDFVGHIFLRKDKLVLLIWVGDQAKYAAGLRTVYDSFTAIR